MLSSDASRIKTPSTSSSSISSIDLDAIPFANCSLMSESLSLDTVSTQSDTSTPPIPHGCMVPMSSFLSTGNSGILLEERGKATTTIPTPPRLRTMLKENLCIERWSEMIRATSGAPGHTPWGNIGECEEVDWIAEGSIHPQDSFHEALVEARSRREAFSSPLTESKAVPDSQDRMKKRQRRKTNCESFRKALVFEREITLNTGGEVKRWSLQVPAVDMSPDMVDVMLELRRLNSFFKEEPEELASIPPALMISNSHSAMALSLPSTASFQTSPAPKTLAVRRGNRPLPPLLTKSEVPGILEVDPYPGIPTAFLGTPAAPQFGHLQKQQSNSKPSGDFKDMISSLRSQCATLQVRPSLRAAHLDESESTHADCPAGLDEEDEWSFARPLLQKYGDQLSHDPHSRPKGRPASVNTSNATTVSAGAADSGATSAQDSYTCPRPLDHDSLTTITPPFDTETNRHPSILPTDSSDSSGIFPSMEKNDQLDGLSSTEDEYTCRRFTPPPSPSPSLSLRSISPYNASPIIPSPRGILKRCKSVRFAESPIEDEGGVSYTIREVQVERPSPALARHSLGSSVQQSVPRKRPSTLRSTPAYNINRNKTLRQSTPINTIPATESQATTSLHAAGRQKSPPTYGQVVTKPPTNATKGSSISTPASPAPASPPCFKTSTRVLTRAERAKSQVSAMGTPVVFPVPKHKATTPASSSPTRSRIEARQTIGASPVRPRVSTSVLRTGEKQDKENQGGKLSARASLSASTYRERYTLDEHVFRKGLRAGSIDVQASSGSSSSRMPVPLRKILTRFK
ncbi:hypothetical protein V5O48_004075 [Marasmius crinis-equi]|uniref:Uncharacterized protein n=1 Tax=Marasmius crinis-equi TaxID=585013 RepID=A0ABR3FR42_9AGAR